MYRLLTPVLAVIVAVTLFTTFIKPTFNEYKRIDTEIADYELALEKADELQQRIAELIADKNSISAADMERLMAFLPDSMDEVEVVMSLDEIANRNRMLLESIAVTDARAQKITDEPAPTENIQYEDEYVDPDFADPLLEEDSLGGVVSESAGISSVPVTELYDTSDVTFTVTGTYEDFKLFMRELEKSLVLMDISKLAIASAEEDDISSYAVTVQMYQFKKPQK